MVPWQSPAAPLSLPGGDRACGGLAACACHGCTGSLLSLGVLSLEDVVQQNRDIAGSVNYHADDGCGIEVVHLVMAVNFITQQ